MAATQVVTRPSSKLIVLAVCAGHRRSCWPGHRGRPRVLTILATVGNIVLGFLETLLWVLRMVYESVVLHTERRVAGAVGHIEHLVLSILECDAADGQQVIVTLLGAPFAGIGALATEWSAWLMSGTENRANGAYNFEQSVFTLPMNTTPAMVEWIADRPSRSRSPILQLRDAGAGVDQPGRRRRAGRAPGRHERRQRAHIGRR